MPVKFPLPADYFRAVSLKPEEPSNFAKLVQHLVEETYQEYVGYVGRERHVDDRKWKVGKTKDELSICMRQLDLTSSMERETYGFLTRSRTDSDLSTNSLSNVPINTNRRPPESTAVYMPNATFAAQRSGLQHDSSIAHGRSRTSLTSVLVSDGANSNRLLDPTVLVVGNLPGSVEDMVFGSIDTSAAAMRNVNAVVSDDTMVDCAVLHTIRKARSMYLGLKWKAIKTIAGNRDVTYLEGIGISATADGQRFGYHVMESVKLWQCPAFDDRSLPRTELSFCSLFFPHPTLARTVEVYMLGTMDSPTNPIASGGLGDPRTTLSLLLRAESLAARAGAKKLGVLVERGSYINKTQDVPNAPCAICTSKPGILSRHGVCEACGEFLCAKCRVKVSIAGWLRKAGCCKRCLVQAREDVPFDIQKAELEFTVGDKVNHIHNSSVSSADSRHSRNSKSSHSSCEKSASIVNDSMTDTEYDPSLRSWTSSSITSLDQSPPPVRSSSGHLARSVSTGPEMLVPMHIARSTSGSNEMRRPNSIDETMPPTNRLVPDQRMQAHQTQNPHARRYVDPAMVEVRTQEPRRVQDMRRPEVNGQHPRAMPNPRMQDPRAVDPRMQYPRTPDNSMQRDPRAVNPTMQNPRSVDPRMQYPRTPDHMMQPEQRWQEPRTQNMQPYPRKVDPRMQDPRMQYPRKQDIRTQDPSTAYRVHDPNAYQQNSNAPNYQQQQQVPDINRHQMDLYAQMMELTKKAEETYHLAHNNGVFTRP